jgi:hypothetical protein
MRLRSVNLGLALTLTLVNTANASDGFPFLPRYDEIPYEAMTFAIDSAERDAQILPEDWAEPRAELADPIETGAIPARIDHSIAQPGLTPESFVIVDLAEAEPLPLQAISSFDLTLSADPMPTAPNWDTL